MADRLAYYIALAIAGSIGIGTLIIPNHAQSEMPRMWPGVACWPSAHVAALLSERYSEVPIGHGKTSDSNVTVWSSPGGESFSIVVATGADNSHFCIIAQGKNLRFNNARMKGLYLTEKDRRI